MAASELDFDVASDFLFADCSVEVIVVMGSSLGFEDDERLDVGVPAVEFLGGAIRRMGLIVVASVGIRRGDGSAASSNLGVELLSRIVVWCLCSTEFLRSSAGSPGNGFWIGLVSGK